MLKLGKIVNSDYKIIKTVETGLPEKATEISAEALALKKQKKTEKNRKKKQKRKLANSLLAQLSNASHPQVTSQLALPPHLLTLMLRPHVKKDYIVALRPLTTNPVVPILILHYLTTGHPVPNSSGPMDLKCNTSGMPYNLPFSNHPVW